MVASDDFFSEETLNLLSFLDENPFDDKIEHKTNEVNTTKYNSKQILRLCFRLLFL